MSLTLYSIVLKLPCRGNARNRCVLCTAKPKQAALHCLKPLGGWCFTMELNCKKDMGLGLNSLL